MKLWWTFSLLWRTRCDVEWQK